MRVADFPPELGLLRSLPRARLFSGTTQLEDMPNLTRHHGGARLMVKRDDLTELAFGGNKVRQLEFYFGQALAQNADTVLITGAVQSNFARLTAAAARKLAMDCHIQLEERVAKNDPLYRTSGNVLLEKMLGATVHSYSDGEDEEGADRQLNVIAAELAANGQNPFVIPLGPGHAPYGALGYVVMAHELIEQLAECSLIPDEIIVASGSGATHSGLLFGLRALGSDIPVRGICVRRSAEAQGPRIAKKCDEIAQLLDIPSAVKPSDIVVDESVLAPGYGRAGAATHSAILEGARYESLMLDPTYTGKAFAGFLKRVEQAQQDQVLVFIHTGGTPGIFAYQKDIEAACALDEAL